LENYLQIRLQIEGKKSQKLEFGSGSGLGGLGGSGSGLGGLGGSGSGLGGSGSGLGLIL